MRLKVGDHTNAGFILFIDKVSELVPDPVVRVSSTGAVTHRLSELYLTPAPEKTDEKILKEDFKRKEVIELLADIVRDVRTKGLAPRITVADFAEAWLENKEQK